MVEKYKSLVHFLSKNKSLNVTAEDINILSDENIEFMANIDNIKTKEEWKKEKFETFGGNHNKFKLYNNFINYSFYKAKYIPIEMRKFLVNLLEKRDLWVVLELENCTKEEINLFVMKHSYNIENAMIGKNVSETAISHLLDYNMQQLANMKFAPITFAKESEKLKQTIKNISNNINKLSEKDKEIFCSSVINNPNISDNIKNELFAEQDVDISTIKNMTDEIGSSIMDICIESLKSCEDLDEKESKKTKKRLVSEIVKIIECKNTKEIIDKYVEFLEEKKDKELITSNIYQKITHQNQLNEFLLDNMGYYDIIGLLNNECIFIDNKVFDKLKERVSILDKKSHATRKSLYGLLFNRSFVSNNVYKDAIKDYKMNKYIMMCSFKVPNTIISEIINSETNKELKKDLLCIRYLRLLLEELSQKDVKSYENIVYGDKSGYTCMESVKDYPYTKIVKYAMSKVLDKYGLLSKIPEIDKKSLVIDFPYTKEQYETIKSHLKAVKSLYPCSADILDKTEKKIDKARTIATFYEKYSDIFSFNLYNVGNGMIWVELEKTTPENLKQMSNTLKEMNTSDFKKIEHIMIEMQNRIEDEIICSKNVNMKYICQCIVKYTEIYNTIENMKNKSREKETFEFSMKIMGNHDAIELEH